MKVQDTIVALSTALNGAAIALIRLSGEKALEVCNAIFVGANLNKVSSHTLHFGRIVGQDKQTIDEVVVGVFKTPKSYTGEDIVEISCHASPFIVQQILDVCLKAGARLAAPGEFTKRALLNGKMDLSQAEAVADLIASENKSQHQMAMHQMRGGFSKELNTLREKLIHFVALIELELDFSEEDVEFADRSALKLLLNEIHVKLNGLISSFKLGNAIKNGLKTVIAGRPNAGKSTLLNSLLNEDRAIVSDIAGTTRDTIEEVLQINDIQFRLIDTAGIRHSGADTIEKIGIERTLQAIQQSVMLLYMFDATTLPASEVLKDVESYHLNEQQLLLIGNKTDLLTAEQINDWRKSLGEFKDNLLLLSANENKHIEDLKQAMYNKAIGSNLQQSETIVSNVRHYEALQKSAYYLALVEAAIDQNLSGDLMAADIKSCLYYIGSISGQIEHDRDILGTIFGKFCIGK